MTAKVEYTCDRCEAPIPGPQAPLHVLLTSPAWERLIEADFCAACAVVVAGAMGFGTLADRLAALTSEP